jgi:hypothetical protein
MRCLEKDPSKRFANAAELAESLRPFGKHAAHCAQRCATLLATPVRRSEPAQAQPQLSVAARADGRIPTGVAGRIPTGVAGRIPTGVAGRIPTGVAGRMPTGVSAQKARVPTSSVALSSRVRRSTIDPLSAPVAAPQQSMLAPVRRIPTAQDVAASAPAAAPPKAEEAIDDRQDTVPGLRPRSVNWVILGASALLALGCAYFAFAY